MNTFKLKSGGHVVFDGFSATYTTSGSSGKTYVMDAGVVSLMQQQLLDADGAVFFQRQLEHIKSKSFDVKYAELKARGLFPVSNEAGAGATSITYRTYDQSGVAKIINAYAKDLPRADVAGKETTIPVRTLGVAFGYNIDEINSSQMVGASLDQRRANAARRANEQAVNDVAFYGDADAGLPGLFSNPNIPTGNVVNPGSGTAFVNKTPDQIIFDLNDGLTDVFETTNMVEVPDTILMPPAQWSYIMSTPRSSNSDTTIGKYFADNNAHGITLDSIIPVNECAASKNPLLTADAMVFYRRDPDKLQLEIPSELQFLPVQRKGLEFEVPTHSRLAGLNIYYPLSLIIKTGI